MMMKRLGMTSNAILMLTAERSGHLNWLHRHCNLHERILEETRIQICNIGDEAYVMPEAMDRKGLKATFIIYS
jgi:hypothetical protein